MTHGKRRLVIRDGRIYDEDTGTSGTTAEVYFEQEAHTFTGLYDHTGTELHRPKEPVGYNPHRWSKS